MSTRSARLIDSQPGWWSAGDRGRPPDAEWPVAWAPAERPARRSIPLDPPQIHFGLFVDSLDDLERHLHEHLSDEALIQPHLDSGLIVMLDPAGHPFCIATRLCSA